jgi:hypothetical protein
MTIFVDHLVAYPHAPYGHRLWCHMMTDDLSDHGLEELHTMARKIGLSRSFFQNKRYLPHYDLTAQRRLLALRYGAQEVTSKELVRRCKRHRA